MTTPISMAEFLSNREYLKNTSDLGLPERLQKILLERFETENPVSEKDREWAKDKADRLLSRLYECSHVGALCLLTPDDIGTLVFYQSGPYKDAVVDAVTLALAEKGLSLGLEIANNPYSRGDFNQMLREVAGRANAYPEGEAIPLARLVIAEVKDGKPILSIRRQQHSLAEIAAEEILTLEADTILNRYFRITSVEAARRTKTGKQVRGSREYLRKRIGRAYHAALPSGDLPPELVTSMVKALEQEVSKRSGDVYERLGALIRKLFQETGAEMVPGKEIPASVERKLMGKLVVLDPFFKG